MATYLMLMLTTLCMGTLADHLDPYMVGDRQAIVYLMSWNWKDIANECERYLGPNGFGGVQISPPNEHAIELADSRTWFERYMPVSYELESASGTEAELRDMVKRCNDVGVRVYADAVINHMAFSEYPSIGKGSAGNVYDMSTLSYPAVPYAAQDFSVYNKRCTSLSGDIEDTSDVDQVRNCNLDGLPDLDTSVSHVRLSIATYMNTLIDIGVAGFHVHMAENIWPEDLKVIFDHLKDLNTDFFNPGSRPIIFQQVRAAEGYPIKPSEYLDMGRVTEFNYGRAISGAVRGTEKTLAFLKDLEFNFNLIPSSTAVVFTDTPTSQRLHSHPTDNFIDFMEPRMYTIANAFMLAHPYGLARLMSSYAFNFDNEGPPSDIDGNTLSPVINEDGSCGNGWVCEHRWRAIKNLVGFRAASVGQPIANLWNNGNQQIAFSRGAKAYIVFNNEGIPLSEKLLTGLPQGEYCDVFNGDFDTLFRLCSGPTITVDNSGYALFTLKNTDNPVTAIHVNAIVSEPPNPPFDTPTTKPTTQTSTTQTPASTSTQSSTPLTPSPSFPPPYPTTQRANEDRSDDAPDDAPQTAQSTIKTSTTHTPASTSTQSSTSKPLSTEHSTPPPYPTTEGANKGESGNVPQVVTTQPTIKASTTQSTSPSIPSTSSTTLSTKSSTTTQGANESRHSDAPQVVTTTTPTINQTQVNPASTMNHSIIFIHKDTAFGQFMFVRGGISHEMRSVCTPDARTSACAIPISHRSHGDNVQYNTWKIGDNYLDWYGAEEGQNAYENIQAGGTPMIWTTNNPSSTTNVDIDGYGYTPLNQWGDNYWMVDLDMDCSKTEGGWFEFKGYLMNAGNGWENDIMQEQSCTGSAGEGSLPYPSINHFGRCGYVNVFKFGTDECIIDAL